MYLEKAAMVLKVLNAAQKHLLAWIVLSICLLLMVSCASTSPPDLASIPLERALSSGKPALAEFGWRTCVPCKMMKPILEELAVEYRGKLNVVIVEVYEHRDLSIQYQIMAIPTQIFFDSSGKEITRHMGFWPKEEIIAQLQKMGIE